MAHPDGTKAWRKSHRRKWREGSSYRDLTLLQRELLRWVEDNADDLGRTPPTGQHYLARLLSSPREAISRDQIQRAAVTLERVGLVSREPHSLPHKEPHKEPHKTKTIYVRAKFDEYQRRDDEPHKEPHKQVGREPRLGGRGRQKKAEEEKTTAPEAPLPPGTDWSGLLAAMTREWAKRYDGKKLVLQGKDFKPIRSLVVSLTDEEVFRRWVNYLANPDPFYAGHPVAHFVSQVNRFVVAPAPTHFREPWEGSSPAGPQDWREAP